MVNLKCYSIIDEFFHSEFCIKKIPALVTHANTQQEIVWMFPVTQIIDLLLFIL